jgi:hypothetical protein
MHIGKDKYKHAIAGIIFAVIFTELGLTALTTLWLVLAVGVAKEVYDYFDYGVFDKWDVLATIAPVLFYYILTILA